MGIELLDKATERKAIDTVKQAVDLWTGEKAETPSVAIIKAAEDKDFTPEMLSRITESFNGAIQLAHFETASQEKRADTIPLADASVVVAHFFPEQNTTKQEKAATVRVPDAYEQVERGNFMRIAPQMEKAASTAITFKPRAYPRDKSAMLKTAGAAKAAALRRAEVLRGEARAHMDQVIKLASEMVAYFRTPGHVPFEQVEKRARAHHGDVVATLLDAVYNEGKLEQLHEKRASVIDGQVVYVDDFKPPYAFIKVALAQGEQFAKKMMEIVDIQDEAEAKYAAAVIQLEKDAVDPVESIQTALGMGEDEKSEGPAPILTALPDPEHEARLASIEQQFVLNDLMNNDPVISAVDPKSVTQAFNRLSGVAPLVARDPTMLRGILRRYVQNPDVDPFEMKSLVELDKALRDRDAPAAEQQRSYVVV